MNEELISIIIPAYNAGQYLENCLESILKQTYDNYEIVLVNDGSTDNTGNIMEQYQKRFPEKIHVIYTTNKGVTKARLEGINASKGEWIGFVDADDEIESNMYSRLYLNAIQYRADISHCGHITIVNGGERVHEFYNTGRVLFLNKKEGLKELLDGSFEPGLWSKLFRKSLLQTLLENNVMDSSIKYYEDLLMNYYLFSYAENSIYEDFCGYHYLARSTSATRGAYRIEKVLNPILVYKTIMQQVEQELKKVATRKYLEACIRAYASLSNRSQYKEKKIEIRKDLIKQKKNWHLLNRNYRIKLSMLLFSPRIYRIVYGFYASHFQKTVYE